MDLNTDSEREAMMRAIDAIPAVLLPDGPAKAALRAAVDAGEDVDVYMPVQRPKKHPEMARWNVWYQGRRYSLEEWRKLHGETVDLRNDID